MSAEVVARLHPPRLPEAFTTAGPADLLLAFGLGLLGFGLVFWLIAPALTRRTVPPSARARAKAARALPPGEGMLALAELAAQQGTGLTPEEQRALYARDPGATPEALADRLARGRGRWL
ncbi:hypothetical protein ACFOHK_20370 [Falsigemmobacter intermedius]|uniref:Uncharacterized protein n=1 Tax=Falsigemmobacter intermedius TaxID=1553448 RepID=A0A444MBT4_9RHOB|nr:hypothetical protein [Falsigemmobacter intermedius]RWY41446.1 hypothetical protein EP867_09685 [Falsigemmobacter intermedius]